MSQTKAALATAASPLVKAARGERTDHTPVWFMRQAGRSLPEYRELRAQTDMMTACTTTDLITEITLQPVRRHGVDAAILFSDIVIPLRLAGVDVDIKPGVGPVVAKPIRQQADVDRIGELADFESIGNAIADITAELGPTPLIGFCGAPYTVASYLIEGGPSRDHVRTKSMMWSEPALWDSLLAKVADLCGAFLQAQVAAGVSMVQVFDSWAGSLQPADYRNSALPYTQQILAKVPQVPRINFGTGTAEFLGDMAVSDCDVVGVDHRLDLVEGVRRVGSQHSVQGNLDPAMLFADESARLAAVDHIIAAGRQARGHIFNLGHGVLPDTDPGVITDLVAYIHEQ